MTKRTGKRRLSELEALRASAGDRVIIHGHQLGEPSRDGEVLEVFGRDGKPPFLVRWDDGRVSRLYPSSDAVVHHFRRAAPRRTGKRS